MRKNFKNYISTSGLIKITIKIILFCSILLIILESKNPPKYNISEIKNLSINTPILVTENINIIYIEEKFSILNISNNKTSIIGTINENYSKLNLSNKNKYSIIGKISIYNSKKQITIHSIKELS